MTDEKGVQSQNNDGNEEDNAAIAPNAAKAVEHLLDGVDEDRTDSFDIKEHVDIVLDDALIHSTIQFVQNMLEICISREWAEQSFSNNMQNLYCSRFRINKEDLTKHEEALFRLFERLTMLQLTNDEGEQEKLVAALKNNLKGLEQLDENKIASALYSQQTERFRCGHFADLGEMARKLKIAVLHKLLVGVSSRTSTLLNIAYGLGFFDLRTPDDKDEMKTIKAAESYRSSQLMVHKPDVNTLHSCCEYIRSCIKDSVHDLLDKETVSKDS